MSDEGWSTGKKVVVFGCAGMLLLGLLCGGGVFAFGVWAKNKAVELEAMTPEERAEWMQDLAGGLSEEWDPTVDVFLDHLNAGEIAEAYAMTTPALQANVNQQGFADLQSRIEAAMGAYRTRGTQNVNRKFGSGSGTTITYQAAYANGGGTLTVTLVENPSGTGYLIDQYKVDSPLLLQALPGGIESPAEGDEEPR